MPKLTEKELKEQIKTENFSNVYMLYGEESYLKEYYVGKLKEKLVDSAFADFNFHQHEGKNSSIDDILQDAEMLPMMSEYSLVLVHDYPLDKNQGDLKALKEFFKDIPPSCVLVFWFDSIEVDTKKSAKWRAIEKEFSSAGCSVNLEKRSESELVKLILSSAKKRSCTITSQNAAYIISVVGSDIQTIFSELEKFCAFAAGGEITKEIIDDLAIKSLQARVYDLSKFILKGDGDNAYKILETLFAQKEEPISILAVISSTYVDMYRVKCAKAAGENEMNLTEFFTYRGREFLIRNAARDCRTISIASLRSALDHLTEADMLMKSTSVDGKILLEETVAKLLMLKRSA
ncbi:MAG: DNA polymerase III subunit delta [Eubacterium sp.]|nr:DNA polymerase III subunit delta [Eubacterium sp.]